MSDYTERKRRYVHDLESKIATHVCTEDSFRAFETEIWVRVIDYRRQALEAALRKIADGHLHGLHAAYVARRALAGEPRVREADTCPHGYSAGCSDAHCQGTPFGRHFVAEPEREPDRTLCATHGGDYTKGCVGCAYAQHPYDEPEREATQEPREGGS